MGWIRYLAAILLVGAVSFFARAENGPQGADAILDAFVEVTLKGEFSTRPGAELRLTRWAKPLTWSVLGETPAGLADDIEVIFRRASELSGGALVTSRLEPVVLRPQGKAFETADAPIRDGAGSIHLLFDKRHVERPVVATYSSANRLVVTTSNVLVLYGGRGFLSKIARVLPNQPKSLGDGIETGQFDCLAYTWAPPGSQIDHAVVLATAGLEPAVRSRCLWEELGQVLGVRNDFADATFSIFTNRSDGKPERWTAFDEGVIRLLYDPALKLGMTAAEVKAAARPLLPKSFGAAAK